MKRKSKYYLAGQEISEKKFNHQTFEKVTLNRSFSKNRFFKKKKKISFFEKWIPRAHKKFTTKAWEDIFLLHIHTSWIMSLSISPPIFKCEKKNEGTFNSWFFVCWCHELKSFFSKLAPSSLWTNSANQDPFGLTVILEGKLWPLTFDNNRWNYKYFLQVK